MKKVFVYGTLMDDRTWEMLGIRYTNKKDATLSGWHRIGLNIIKQEGSSVEGYVVTVTPEVLKVLDRYEGCPEHYERISLNIGEDEAYAYRIT